MDSHEAIDYLVLGHICRDIIPDGYKMGGTAAYSAVVARELGCRTAVLTSSSPRDAWEVELPGIAICDVPAEQTTTFENIYLPDGRVQIIHAVAKTLEVDDIPEPWLRAKIVHLGPINREIDPAVAFAFSNSMIGLTPQGWMRRWNEDGHIYARKWEMARDILPLAAATIISDEDLLDRDMLTEYRSYAPILVLTKGPKGCTVFVGDEVRDFAAPDVDVVELTGAGDSFAAAFFVRLYETGGNPWEAARFANEVAALSIQADGIRAIADIIRLNRSRLRD